MNRRVTISRGLVALALGTLASAGCKARDSAADPSRPAVVKAPPLVLPSDTMKPDTTTSHRDRMQALSRELVQPYALMAAAAVWGDRRMLGSFYAPDGVLKFDDSTFTGRDRVVEALVSRGRLAGLAEWNRQSRVLTGHPDSVYVDSGSYVMVAKRPGAKDRTERGLYVATWRHQGGDNPWILLRDEIKPATSRR